MEISAVPGREVVVKRVGVLSVGRIYAAISAAVGLLLGIGVALSAMVGIGLNGQEGGAFLGAAFGVGAIVFAPILYGAIGFIGGMFGALLYNVFAGMVGGVSVELQ